MTLSAEEIIQVMEKAKELGFKSVKCGGFEADLSQEDTKPAIVSEDKSEFYKEMNALDRMTEEEILFWSTPHFDEIQAKKEALQKEIKENSL